MLLQTLTSCSQFHCGWSSCIAERLKRARESFPGGEGGGFAIRQTNWLNRAYVCALCPYIGTCSESVATERECIDITRQQSQLYICYARLTGHMPIIYAPKIIVSTNAVNTVTIQRAQVLRVPAQISTSCCPIGTCSTRTARSRVLRCCVGFSKPFPRKNCDAHAMRRVYRYGRKLCDWKFRFHLVHKLGAVRIAD